ncbi:MAG: malectin [Pyrinomonadaceae bacterium]
MKHTFPASPFNLGFLCALLFITGLFGAQEARAQGCTFAPKTDRNTYALPALPSLPAAGGKFCDPVFGTEIMRVTDQNTDSGKSFGTFYSTWPTFNKNSTKLLVRKGTDNNAVVYDFVPATFTRGAKHDIPNLPGGGILNSQGAVWSSSSPDLLYGVSNFGLKLWEVNLATNPYTFTLIYDFSSTSGINSTIHHLWQMSMSDDNDVFAFTVRDNALDPKGFLVFKRSSNSVIRNEMPATGNHADFNEVKIDKTGRYLGIPLNGNNSQGKSFYVRDLQTGTEAALADFDTFTGLYEASSPQHSDLGTANILAWDRWKNRMLHRNLNSLLVPIIALEQDGDWTQGKHVSLLETKPGQKEEWGLLSFFDESGTPTNGLFHNEVFQVETNGSQRVRRLFHHRSIFNDYWAIPFANISRDGQFVAFTSNWGDTLVNQSGGDRQDLFIARITAAPSLPLAIRLNAGDSAYYPATGEIWQNDKYLLDSFRGTTSSTSDPNQPIANTTEDVLYRSERYGTLLKYAIPVPNGSYTVRLHFAEYYWGLGGRPGTGSRVFNVKVETAQVLTNFDIYAEAGALTALIKESQTTVNDSVLNIDLTAVTDNAKISAIEVLAPSDTGFWTNVVGATANGNDLTKTGAAGWNAGATSVQSLTGDGYVEFSTGETTTNKMAGLNSNHVGQNYTEIDYTIGLSPTSNVRIYENSTPITNPATSTVFFGTYVAGDVFRVAVESGVVKYYQNGTLLYTSTVSPSYPLVLDTSLNTTGATITDAQVVAGAIDVIWTNLVGTTASGNDLTKPTTGTAGWNAGATSTQSLTGDGYVEFSTGETTTNKMAGLNSNHVGQNYTEIDYTIGLSPTSNVRIYENSTPITNPATSTVFFGTYVAGDVFRVAVESGVVKYYQNGTLLYTSTVSPASPLVLDTSLYTPGATITNARIAGN